MPNMQTATIYTLTNPLNGSIFYVGCTTASLYQRLHRGHDTKTPTGWNLKEMGMFATIEAVETCDVSISMSVERYWIHQFLSWGFPLENKKKIPKTSPVSKQTPPSYHEKKAMQLRLKFIRRNADNKTVDKACRLLGVSKSVIGNAMNGKVKNKTIANEIIAVLEKLIAA